MKKRFTSLVLIAASLLTIQAQQVPQVGNILGRNISSLNGDVDWGRNHNGQKT